MEKEGCSGTSEKASAINDRDCVSAVTGAVDGGWVPLVGWGSCVGVAKGSVEVAGCDSVGISAS